MSHPPNTIGVASGVATSRDIIQNTRTSREQESIREAEYKLADRDKPVIQQLDAAHKNRVEQLVPSRWSRTPSTPF